MMKTVVFSKNRGFQVKSAVFENQNLRFLKSEIWNPTQSIHYIQMDFLALHFGRTI